VSGTIVDVLMAPLAPYELVIGYVSAAVLRAVIIVLLLIAAISPFVDIVIENWLLAFAVALLASISFAILGVINGIMATRMEHVAGTAAVVIAPLTMLAGTFYSVAALEEPFRSISYANPVFYMVDAFRAAFTGTSEGHPFLTLLGLLALNAALVWITVHMLRTGYRLKT
jgi:ABC-2 type transport system permease protein